MPMLPQIRFFFFIHKGAKSTPVAAIGPLGTRLRFLSSSFSKEKVGVRLKPKASHAKSATVDTIIRILLQQQVADGFLCFGINGYMRWVKLLKLSWPVHLAKLQRTIPCQQSIRVEMSSLRSIQCVVIVSLILMLPVDWCFIGDVHFGGARLTRCIDPHLRYLTCITLQDRNHLYFVRMGTWKDSNFSSLTDSIDIPFFNI